jgi:hypothetical protein
MDEETLPGAALEAPETFRVLAAPLWPRLPLAVGYTGGARWVALYVSSDHAMYHDGAESQGACPLTRPASRVGQVPPAKSAGLSWSLIAAPF